MQQPPGLEAGGQHDDIGWMPGTVGGPQTGCGDLRIGSITNSTFGRRNVANQPLSSSILFAKGG